MFKVTLPVYEVNEQETQWQVAFEIIWDDEVKQYAPTTVYKYEVNTTDKATILEHAARKVLPQQIAMYFGKYQTNEDFFDSLAKSLSDKVKNDSDTRTDEQSGTDHQH